MKKILLTLLAVSSVSAFAVNTTPAVLNINGVLPSGCTVTLDAGTSGFANFVAGMTPTSIVNSVNLGCTAGTLVTGFTAASLNAGVLKGQTSGNIDTITYVMTASAATDVSYAGQVATGPIGFAAAGVNIPVSLLANSTVTIDGLGTTLTAPLTISIPSAISATLDADTYKDTVTFMAQY